MIDRPFQVLKYQITINIIRLTFYIWMSSMAFCVRLFIAIWCSFNSACGTDYQWSITAADRKTCGHCPVALSIHKIDKPVKFISAHTWIHSWGVDSFFNTKIEKSSQIELHIWISSVASRAHSNFPGISYAAPDSSVRFNNDDDDDADDDRHQRRRCRTIFYLFS